MASITVQAVFAPTEAKSYSDDITITSDAVSSPDTVAITGESFQLTNAKRWDLLSYEWFGSFKYVQEIKDANPLISMDYKKTLWTPSNITIIKPTIEELSEIGQAQKPDWRK